MVDENDAHAAYVAAWLEGAAEGLPTPGLIDLLELACNAFWARVQPTLGVVTLGAIVDRVMLTASEHFPPFASLAVGPTGVRCDGLRAWAEGLREEQLKPALHFLLVEFLTVLGRLTAEVLTPALYTALRTVRLAAPTEKARGKRKPRAEPKPLPAGGKKRRKS